MESIIAAAIQLTSSSKKEENYKKVDHFVRKAIEHRARLIVLPEHWDWLGRSEQKQEVAEPIEGPSIQFIQRLATTYQCWIVAGSITEANGKKPPFNAGMVVYPDGSLGKTYRKIHLFDAKVQKGHKESEHVSAGSEIVVENLGWGTLGYSICYDVRFPELYRELTRQGATLLVIPSNFTAYTGAPHWEVLVRARAIENQCFVIAADQTGLTGAGWEAHGHSMIVDPWGEILVMAGQEEGIITAELKLIQLSEVRGKMPVQAHRKLL